MFQLSLRYDGRVRRYSIHEAGPAGWEVKFEEDRTLRRHDLYQDWHRVERAMALFEREVSELTAQGWRVTQDERQSMKR